MSRRLIAWPWLIVFAALAFAFWGVRPLGEPDEGRYAEAAREMLVTGQWLVPHLDGQPHWTKPPLTYWAAAAGMRLLGVNEWGARLGLSLAFFVTILAVVALADAWGRTRDEALAAGLVFGTAALPFAAGHLLTTDTFLTCFETLSVLCAWRVWRGPGHAVLWRWGFWLAFGLAFLTKGPPAWLPLLAMALFAVAGRPRRRARARVLWQPGGLIVMLAVSFSWFLVVMARFPDLGRYFLVNELINRVLTAEHGREGSPGIYPATLLLGMGPWLLLWPEVVRRAGVALHAAWSGSAAAQPVLGATRAQGWLARAWRAVRECLSRGRRASAALEDTQWFSILWVAAPLTIFLLARSRMILYVLPLFVPLAIWFGVVAAGLWARRAEAPAWARRAAWLLCGFWLAVMLAVVLAPETFPKARSPRMLARRYLAATAEPARAPPDAVIALANPKPHGFSFYTGLFLGGDESLSFRKNMKRVDALARGGQRLHLVMRRIDVRVLADYPALQARELARDHALAIVECVARAGAASSTAAQETPRPADK